MWMAWADHVDQHALLHVAWAVPQARVVQSNEVGCCLLHLGWQRWTAWAERVDEQALPDVLAATLTWLLHQADDEMLHVASAVIPAQALQQNEVACLLHLGSQMWT